MVLGEADRVQALNVIDLLGLRGLKNIVVARDSEQLREAIQPRDAVAPMVDILVCDMDLPGIDLPRTVQDIRHGRLGVNPFLILIATVPPIGHGSHADVRRVLASGVDDLLVKPIPGETLVKRLAAFIEGRDLFAVTDLYVGPDRHGARPDEGLGGDASMQVPNTLRSKLVKNMRGSEIRAHLEAARKDVASKKTETNVRTIVAMIKRIRHNIDEARIGEIRRGLQVLADKSDKVAIEFFEARISAAAEISVQIARLSRKFEAAPDRPGMRELGLLEQLADALLISFSASGSASEVSRRILTAVDDLLDWAS